MPNLGAGSPAMVLITVCIVQFMAPLMLTAVGVALPSLGRDIRASAVQLGLVEQLYVLSVAMTMLTLGRLGDLVGQRKVFLPGLMVFPALTLSLAFTQSTDHFRRHFSHEPFSAIRQRAFAPGDWARAPVSATHAADRVPHRG